VQSLQVIYALVRSVDEVQRFEASAGADLEWERTIRTNAVPFVLLPQVVDLHGGEVSRDGEMVVYGEVTLEADLVVGVGQKVFLFLNQIGGEMAYIFPAQRRSVAGSIVSFLVREVVAGRYLVRLQVDGAESLLEIEGEAYGRPRLEIQ
jgi:hypothetical protein